MNARSFLVYSIEELEQQLETTFQEYFVPSVGLAFGDTDFDIEAALRLFKKYNIDLIGCTSAGEICDDQIADVSFGVLLLDLEKDAYDTIHVAGTGFDYFSVGVELAIHSTNKFKNPSLITYIGGMGVDGESAIRGIKSVTGPDVALYGGMGGDNFQFESIHAFDQNGIYDNGIAALILDSDRVDVKGKSYSGWNELGKWHQITKCEGNVLFEVDGNPALDLFNQYFKNLEFKMVESNSQLFTHPGVFALSVKRDNGELFMRSTLLFDFENRALVLAGGVKNGDSFRFCPTPSLDVIEDTINQFDDLPSEFKNPDAVIMNSCAARFMAFGPLMEDEVKGIWKIFNSAPMIGYLAYGEIGKRDKDPECSFHNVTCSLLTLSDAR